MSSQWIVLKFGGTSVAGRAQWETIARLAAERRREGFRVLLVCSAVAGVTSALSALADEPAEPRGFDAILQRHEDLARELGVDAGPLLAEASQRLADALARLASGEDYAPRADLLAVGEWLGTRIGAAFLQQSLPVEWVDARELLLCCDEPDLSPVRRWLSADCLPGPDPQLIESWAQRGPVTITQGYLARNTGGHTVLLGRGGSDTSAALLAGRLQAARVEIWTDVPGLFSADPRQVDGARLLARLGYEEALEMAASGARVVHPRAIRAAQATGTAMVVRDAGRPELEGTRIERQTGPAAGVRAVTCQRDMVVLLLQNRDMRREVGFLARVFDAVRGQGVSVDLVATSETTTTLALNATFNHLDAAGLQSLVRDLRAHCTVGVYEDCVCVNLVGRGIRTALPDLADALGFFRDHDLLMLSQSANDLCVSLLLPATGHATLLRRAHDALVPGDGDDGYGPSWQELESG